MASFSYKAEAGPCRPNVRYPTQGRRYPRGAAPGGPTTSGAPFVTGLPARSASLGSLGTSYLLTPCSTLSPAPGAPQRQKPRPLPVFRSDQPPLFDGRHPAMTHRRRAGTRYGLLSRNASTLARPVGVRPTIRVPPSSHRKCWHQSCSQGARDRLGHQAACASKPLPLRTERSARARALRSITLP